MTKFIYTAEKSDGEVYKGTAEVADRFELYSLVRREGGKIVSVEEEGGKSVWSLQYWNSKLTTVKEYDKILMSRNLGAMLGAGLPLSRSLAVLERQTKNPRLSATISQVSSDVRKGETLHASLAKHPKIFSDLFVAMVRAGEEGGDLPTSLKVVSEQMERMYDLKKKIRGAMIYPSIILIAIFGIGVVMMIVVVPTLAQTFKEMDTELPKATRLVIAVSDFLVTYTVVALGLIVVFFGMLYAAARSPTGKRALDFVLLHTPVIGGMAKEVNAARTSRTLASLISSGVDVLTALDIVREVIQNSFFRTVVESAKVGVAAGEPLSAAFARREDLYPAFVGEMMAVGEETGQTADMLKRLALFYEEEVDRKTKDMSTIIEPFLMILIGGAVGFFAYAMITPIYSLSQAIN